MPKPHLALLAGLLLAAAVWFVSPHLDPYHLDVLTGIGINVILAVSLNLVNGKLTADVTLPAGITGQFEWHGQKRALQPGRNQLAF